MTDRTIIKMAEESTALLRQIPVGFDATNIVPSFNAILAEAKANHPDDVFIKALSAIESSDNAFDLAILFTQLRIALEALNTEETEKT